MCSQLSSNNANSRRVRLLLLPGAGQKPHAAASVNYHCRCPVDVQQRWARAPYAIWKDLRARRAFAPYSTAAS